MHAWKRTGSVPYHAWRVAGDHHERDVKWILRREVEFGVEDE